MYKRRRSTHYMVAAAPHLHCAPFAERRLSLRALKRATAGEVTNSARPHTLSRRRSTVQAALGLPYDATVFALMPETDHRLTGVVLPGNRGELKAPAPARYAARSNCARDCGVSDMRLVTWNFAEPNVQNDPSPRPSAGSFPPWPRCIGAAVAAAEPTWRHVMSAEHLGTATSLGRSDPLQSSLWSAGSDHAPGRVDLFGKMTNLVKGG